MNLAIGINSPKGMWLQLWLRLSLSCDPWCLVLGKMLRDAAMDWDGPELEGMKKRGEGEKEEKEGEGDIHVAGWRHCFEQDLFNLASCAVRVWRRISLPLCSMPNAHACICACAWSLLFFPSFHPFVSFVSLPVHLPSYPLDSAPWSASISRTSSVRFHLATLHGSCLTAVTIGHADSNTSHLYPLRSDHTQRTQECHGAKR